ncbi:MAG: hypothetical protein ABSA44_09585 [Bacteroidota bacterium]|jgi:hypothetical protein
MRKAVSADYDVFAIAGGKIVHWKVSVKKVAVLNEAQSAGTWIDVTDHLDNTMPDKISESIELLMGQFATMVLNFKGLDIAWWKANIFNATQYLELKVDFWLNDLTTDTITPFGGWIDKKKDGKWCVTSDEATDTVVFSVAGYLEYAARTSAVAINTQIPVYNMDGGQTGIVLQKLPGLYLHNANVSGYPLKKGIHSIQLSYTAGTPDTWTASLDGGIEVTLPASDGYVTLGNGNGQAGDINQYDNQQVTILVTVAELQPLITSVTQGIVQKATGDVFPQTWLIYFWVFQLLRTMFEQIGITSFTFDNFRIKTYDGRHVPSFWDVPPGESYYAQSTAIACDNTNNLLWVGIKDRIYKHDLSTHLYTLIDAAPTGYIVVKLWSEDLASGFIWGVARNAAGAHKIIRLGISGSTIDTYAITRTTNTLGGESNFAIDLTVRGIYYLSHITSVVEVRLFLLNTLAESSYATTGGEAICQDMPAFCDGAGNYYYQLIYSTNFIKINFNGTSFTLTTLNAYSDYPIQQAVYSNTLGLWFGCRYRSASPGYYEIVKWNPQTNNSLENNSSVIQFSMTKPGGFVSDEVNGWVYYFNNDGLLNQIGTQQYVNRINATPITGYTSVSRIGDPFPVGTNADEFYSSNKICYDKVNDRLIGLSLPLGLLFEFGATISMYIAAEADYSSATIYDALKELFSFNIMPRISGQKQAFAYRRFDENGVPVTTGNMVTLDADKAKNISEDTGYGDAYDVVTVDNGVNSVSCDANGFDAVAMGDDKDLYISCRFIADNLLKDFAFWYYNYWKTSKTRYQVPTPVIPFFQFEPFDSAALNFAGKINTLIESVPANGPIIGQGISRDGTTEFEVVI